VPEHASLSAEHVPALQIAHVIIHVHVGLFVFVLLYVLRRVVRFFWIFLETVKREKLDRCITFLLFFSFVPKIRESSFWYI
jgi:hypothetical protein